jgi:hypothetical protein
MNFNSKQWGKSSERKLPPINQIFDLTYQREICKIPRTSGATSTEFNYSAHKSNLCNLIWASSCGVLVFIVRPRAGVADRSERVTFLWDWMTDLLNWRSKGSFVWQLLGSAAEPCSALGEPEWVQSYRRLPPFVILVCPRRLIQSLITDRNLDQRLMYLHSYLA